MKKQRKRKKGLAMLLTSAMVVGLVPGGGTLQVSATESDENTVNTVSSNEVMTPEQTDGQATDKLITDWQWIDEEEYLDEETGSLSLPGANEQTPAYFDDVTAFLPTQIQATVVNADDSENPETGVEETISLGDWECDNYPVDGAYSGSYTFTAALPEGYTLSEEAKALTVLVELGGAQMWSANGSWGNGLSWTLNDEGTLTFEGYGDIPDGYQSWGDQATSVKEIVIGECVTGIGKDAFLDCESLTTVSFADERVSTLSIGDFAFGSCTALESIVIPNYVTTLGSSAFELCSSLQSVTFEAGSRLNAISDSTFYACYKLETINIPSSVESIGDSAFGYCTSLKTITIPDSVKMIDRAAFWGCSALESIMIPESVATIGDDIFKECSNLKKVTCISGSYAETYLREKYPDLLTVLYKVTIHSEPTEGYTITQADKTALPESGLLLTDGDGSLSFRIEAASGYKKNFTVKADGTEVTAVDGVYTISGITENKTIALTIEGAGPCSHTNYNNGFCIECDAYEPAVYNESRNYYEISNSGQLYWFAGLVNGDKAVCTYNEITNSEGVKQNTAANAVLTQDITLNQKVLDENGALIDNVSDLTMWIPIGDADNQYTGTFGTSDEENKKISGLYYDVEFSNTEEASGTIEYAGLFGYIGRGGRVSNVGIEDSYYRLVSKGECCSGYVGSISGVNQGSIVGCYNKGIVYVEGNYFCAGGVCGWNNNGILNNCDNTGEVTAIVGDNSYIGGVCGYNFSGSGSGSGSTDNSTAIIESSHNTGDVTVNSYNTDEMYTSSGYVGGVCGGSVTFPGGSNVISNCYNEGNITGSKTVGGVCGYNYSYQGTSTIINSYNKGNIKILSTDKMEEGVIGGICGHCWPNNGTLSIDHCYSSGEVSSAERAGGVCGQADDGTTVNDCYYDNEKCTGNAIGNSWATITTSKVEGKTTAGFTSGEVAYLLQDGNAEAVWGQKLGKNGDAYPVLKKERDEGNTVYQNIVYSGCSESNQGDTTYVYANNAADPVYAAHTIGENGICSKCNQKLKYKVSLTSTVDGIDAEDTVALLTGGGLYTIGTEATVTAPEKEGFTFKGWYNSEYGEPRSEKLSYTFIPQADTSLVAVYEANASITLNVNGERGGYYVNGELQASNSYTRSFKAGSYVYVGYSGSGTFCYWKNASGNIVSREREYTFTLVSDTSLTAVAVGDSAGSEESGYSALVEFVSCYGQVIQATTWNSKDEASGKTLPAAPSKFGGTFKYWSLDGTNEATAAAILAAINGSTTRITVVPVYEEITTTYSITVKYPSDSNKDDVVYDNQKLGNTLTVTADSIEGKEFAYWSSDAEGTTKLSYSLSYFLLVSGNTTLYPIYSDAAVEEQPVVAITNVSRNTVDSKNKLSFEVTRSIPAKYELVEQGVIYSVADIYASDETAMVIDAGSVYKFVSSDTANNGVFIANMNVTGHEDSNLYVKGYVIVKNTETGNTETIYTDMAAKSYNDLPQN